MSLKFVVLVHPIFFMFLTGVFFFVLSTSFSTVECFWMDFDVL